LCHQLRRFLPRDAMQVRPIPSRGVCLSVCLATFVDSVETNKRIIKIFSPTGSHTILVFAYQTSWQYSDKGGIECRRVKQKSQYWTNMWLSIDDCCSANNNCDGGRCSLPHRPPRISEFMSKPAWSTTTKRREQNII